MEATQAKPTETPPENVTNLPARRDREIIVVNDPIAVLDTGRFDHMMRIARAMAASTLIPEGLCMEGKGDDRKLMPMAQIAANCFLVVNQAVRWGMDPFAVAQCVSVVHGKLCYEGKLIAAVLNAKLGYDLEYELSGEGDAMKVVVTAAKDGKSVVDSRGQVRRVEGSVADWKTTGVGSPWSAPGGKPRMLRYRGAREWSRVHAPALMLGVYSDDEMDDMSENARSNRARDVAPRRILAPDPEAPVEARPQPEQPKTAAEHPQQVSVPRAPDPDAPPPEPSELDRLVGEIEKLAADKITEFGFTNAERLGKLTAQERVKVIEALNKRVASLNRA